MTPEQTATIKDVLAIPPNRWKRTDKNGGDWEVDAVESEMPNGTSVRIEGIETDTILYLQVFLEFLLSPFLGRPVLLFVNNSLVYSGWSRPLGKILNRKNN